MQRLHGLAYLLGLLCLTAEPLSASSCDFALWPTGDDRIAAQSSHAQLDFPTPDADDYRLGLVYAAPVEIRLHRASEDRWASSTSHFGNSVAGSEERLQIYSLCIAGADDSVGVVEWSTDGRRWNSLSPQPLGAAELSIEGRTSVRLQFRLRLLWDRAPGRYLAQIRYYLIPVPR